MSAKLPLAWLQLKSGGVRMLAAVAGVALTAAFSLVQLGFQDALYASVVLLYSHLRADIVLINPRYQCIVATETIPGRRLYQALSVPGVASVSALYVAPMPWKNPATHRDRQIFVVGFWPGADVFDFPAINRQLTRLEEPGSVAFDEASRHEFGPVPAIFHRAGYVESELGHKRVRVIALFRSGASFANDGTAIVTDTTFFNLLPQWPPGIINIGLIKLRPGYDALQMRDRIAAALPSDVAVLTRAAFLHREKAFFGASLPVGLFFRFSVLVGLIVGAVIVYEILYSDVSEHLPEYATVKAIGYTDGYLYRLILQRSLLLSILGSPPGLLLSLAIYAIARRAALLPIHISWAQAVAVYFLTAGMCILAGAFALRKLRQADPADIF